MVDLEQAQLIFSSFRLWKGDSSPSNYQYKSSVNSHHRESTLTTSEVRSSWSLRSRASSNSSVVSRPPAW